MTKITHGIHVPNGTNGTNGNHPNRANQLLTLLSTVDGPDIASDAEKAQLISAARTFLSRVQSPWETIRRYLVDSPAVQLSLKVCMDLNMFQKWKYQDDRPRTVAELSQLTGCDEVLLHRFLRHLATEHLLAEVASGTYAQTEFTLAMCTPHFGAWPYYLDEIVLDTWKVLPRLLAERGYRSDALSMVDGAFQASHDCSGKSIFDYFASHLDQAKLFNNAMTGYGAVRCSWLDLLPSSHLLRGAEDGPLLVDVGGNIGHDVEKFRRRHSDLGSRLILQDLPAVVENAICKDEVQIMPHDFFTPQPVHGARAYYLHSVLHDWPDLNASQILDNLRPALKKGYSKLLINELVVLDTISSSSPQVTSFDLAMLGLCAAHERTESMWRALLEQAGFRIVKVWTNDASVESIIEAEIA